LAFTGFSSVSPKNNIQKVFYNMGAIEVNRKCVKTRGRHAGEAVTVVKLLDGNFAEVRDAKGKVKRCNVQHLEPLA
jgi:large subunit ribosomal protein L14e